jgi:hypothetical protein
MGGEPKQEYQRRREYLRDPSKLPENEFSYDILDAIFWEKCGSGEHTLTIGGIEVTKSLTGLSRSNSGKRQSWGVEIKWTGSDGVDRSVSNGGGRYAGNRRNDEERNWGLPE